MLSDHNQVGDVAHEDEDIWVAPTEKEVRMFSGQFLKGPIPWDWLQAANGLGSQALVTGLAIWHIHALRKNTTVVTNLRHLGKWVLASDSTIRTSLHRLERAGLVKVYRPPGSNIRITLIMSKPNPPNADPG